MPRQVVAPGQRDVPELRVLQVLRAPAFAVPVLRNFYRGRAKSFDEVTGKNLYQNFVLF